MLLAHSTAEGESNPGTLGFGVISEYTIHSVPIQTVPIVAEGASPAGRSIAVSTASPQIFAP